MRKFKSKLSVDGIKALRDELRKYNNDLIRKNQLLVERLAQEGIVVAQQNVGNFGRYITFTINSTIQGTECRAILVAKDTQKIVSQWQTLDGIKSAEVSPLLMAEFGSGQKAQNPLNVQGVGQGTFPGQTHAFEDGWHWQDLDGNWHFSTGISPTMPMYTAMVDMHQKVRMIAREIFQS